MDYQRLTKKALIERISEMETLLHQQVEEQNHQMEELAVRDGLTNLLNHRAIIARLEEEIARSKRYNQDLSVLILDIDGFKRINDTYGHVTGDEVLKDIAHALQELIREIDAAGRYDGEEFLLLFPSTNLDATYSASERIRRALTQLHLPHDIHLSLSGGAAQHHGCGQPRDAAADDRDVDVDVARERRETAGLVRGPPERFGPTCHETPPVPC